MCSAKPQGRGGGSELCLQFFVAFTRKWGEGTCQKLFRTNIFLMCKHLKCVLWGREKGYEKFKMPDILPRNIFFFSSGSL